MTVTTVTTVTPLPTGKCLRCGRLLRSAKSVANGYGPTCGAKIAKAALATDLAEFKPEQVESARVLLADGGVVRLRRSVFLVSSSKGDAVYRTAVQGCTCKAGLRGVRCFHRAAVRILLAA